MVASVSPAPSARASVPRCASCILPLGYPGLDPDASGRCSLCRAHRPVAYRGIESLRADVAALLARHPERRHDCIVGVSGGRDSCYVLHLARRELGLDAVALLVDHGLVPDESLGNVRRITEALGVRLVVHRHARLLRCFPLQLRAWLRRPRPHTLSTLCMGCKGTIITAHHDHARAERAPLLMWGWTPFEQAGYKMDLMRARGVPGRVASYAVGYFGQVAANPALALHPRCAAEQAREFTIFYGPWVTLRDRLDRTHELAPFAGHVHWREEEVTRELEGTYGWRRTQGAASSWRGDCLIAPVRQYLYRAMLGYDDKAAHLSALVRDGQLTRARALEREAAEGVSEAAMEACCARLGIRADDLRDAVARYRAARPARGAPAAPPD